MIAPEALCSLNQVTDMPLTFAERPSMCLDQPLQAIVEGDQLV